MTDLLKRLIVAVRRHPTYVLMQTFEKPLLVFLLKHVTSGAAGGLALGSGLLLLDIAGLRTLMGQSEGGVIAILLLFFGSDGDFRSHRDGGRHHDDERHDRP